jgi:hypothetical protein
VACEGGGQDLVRREEKELVNRRVNGVKRRKTLRRVVNRVKRERTLRRVVLFWTGMRLA